MASGGLRLLDPAGFAALFDGRKGCTSIAAVSSIESILANRAASVWVSKLNVRRALSANVVEPAEFTAGSDAGGAHALTPAVWLLAAVLAWTLATGVALVVHQLLPNQQLRKALMDAAPMEALIRCFWK